MHTYLLGVCVETIRPFGRAAVCFIGPGVKPLTDASSCGLRRGAAAAPEAQFPQAPWELHHRSGVQQW